jgi:hypothetical protein
LNNNLIKETIEILDDNPEIVEPFDEENEYPIEIIQKEKN